EGGDLYLVYGNMLPLKDAGAFATKTNDKEEENQDEEVLEMGESDTEKSDDTRNTGEPRANPKLRTNTLPQRTNR
ncbi:phage portal protein, partial [Enterococcus faecalis]